MVISASRRTDIPQYYMDWFINRLKAGYALARNPFNYKQVSRINLLPDAVTCIVFWTKNPAPMLDALEQLAAYPYYVQFTLHPYGPDLEPGLPGKDILLDVFRTLSDRLGSDRVVWRYSPVIVGGRYSASWHIEQFGQLASILAGYTKRCNLGFLDIYKKIRKQMEGMGIFEADAPCMRLISEEFGKIAAKSKIELRACGNITPGLLPQARCIDDALISKITGRVLSIPKDKGQPARCGCVKSADIGAYDTCLAGCTYCYANSSRASVCKKTLAYDPTSPFLCSTPTANDKITELKK
ncbi:MAG: DUF1848 domain-containing protein [Christensenellaceae bacterium]|jgi:hypothetical protein